MTNSNKAFRVEKLLIENFSTPEYCGIKPEKTLDGNSFFVFGTNSTGKSTSFDAIIYAIFGKEFISRSVGVTNTKITLSNEQLSFEIERKSGFEPRIKINGTSQEIKGSEAVNKKLIELTKIPENISNAKRLINALKLPQQDEDTLLMKYSQKQLEYIITSYSSGTIVSERVEDVDRKIEQLKQELERLSLEKKDFEKEIEDLKLIESKNKNYTANIREFISSYDSGELYQIVKKLQEEEKVKEKIHQLYSERTRVFDAKYKNGMQLSQIRQYYSKDLIDAIKETLSVLVCPVCGENLDLTKIEGRKKQGLCPFCAKKQYDGSLYEKLKSQISYSNKNLDKLVDQKQELEDKLETIETEIKKLEKELGIKINSVTSSVIKELVTEGEISTKYDEYKKILEKHEEEIEISKKEINQLEKKIDEINKVQRNIEAKTKEFTNEKKKINENENSKIITGFNEKINEFYAKLVQPLNHKLSVQKGNVLLDTGISTKVCSEKNSLGFSQKKLVDFAFWATIQILNIQNNVVNLNFGLVDDIFENIDNEEISWRENLYSVLKDLDKETQLIVFSIDKKMNEQLKFPNEKPLQLQQTLEVFGGK
jgi:chromosome segregation ATPase